VFDLETREDLRERWEIKGDIDENAFDDDED
jgi:hypothetical protein